MNNTNSVCDLLIVGAGLSGMAAYLEAVRNSNLHVVIAEHEATFGGELRFYEGFPEAELLRREFESAVVNQTSVGPSASSTVWLKTTVVGVLPSFRPEDPLEVNLSSADGTTTIRCRELLICTGMMDLSRENNRIPGGRPAGVVTPSFVVRALHEQALPGKRPVIFVDDRRDLAAARLLRKFGAELAAVLVSKSVAAFTSELGSFGVPIHECDHVSEVGGSTRVEWVRYVSGGVESEIACDSLVFAKGHRSNTFALKGSGVALDPETEGLAVDGCGQTSLTNVYAAGTCVRFDPAHGQSVAEGRKLARQLLTMLGQLQA